MTDFDWQNRAGNKLPAQRAVWNLKTGEIVISSRAEKIDQSALKMRSNKQIQKERAATDRLLDKAKKQI